MKRQKSGIIVNTSSRVGYTSHSVRVSRKFGIEDIFLYLLLKAVKKIPYVRDSFLYLEILFPSEDLN
ncbi:MAG TPA: hypothetical protein VFI73_01455 [Candidatus Nitrosopolaris sp.]|nr:hypothetical protein [Candidatus Nitrosopolaris sp.]